MTDRIQRAAVVLDDALSQVAEAYDLLSEECRKENRAFMDKSRDKPRIGFAKSVPNVQIHPVYSNPGRLFRAGLSVHPRICKLLNLAPIRAKGVAALISKET